MVANTHYSPYFKSSFPPHHNVIIFLHLKAHDALNDVTMTSEIVPGLAVSTDRQ